MLVNDSIVTKNLTPVENKARGIYLKKKKRERESVFQKSVLLISKQTLRPFMCEKNVYKNLALNGVNENY